MFDQPPELAATNVNHHQHSTLKSADLMCASTLAHRSSRSVVCLMLVVWFSTAVAGSDSAQRHFPMFPEVPAVRRLQDMHMLASDALDAPITVPAACNSVLSNIG